MNGMQRLVQAERDLVDLHKTLAEAIKRLTYARNGLQARGGHQALIAELRTDDLIRVLDRTSKPAEVEVATDSESWWERNSDEALGQCG